MDLLVDLDAADGGRDRVTAIYTAVRDAILDGRLDAGDRLPASRELAGELGVARGTVGAAYDRLVAEGYADARVGSGTYVRAVRAQRPLAVTERRHARKGEVRPVALWERIASVAAAPDAMSAPAPRARSGVLDMSIGVPDPSLFPYDTWRRLLATHARPSRLRDTTYDQSGGGHPGLRAAIARHVGLARSVVAAPDDVLVTIGAQHALDLIARVTLEPGAVVAVEDPGYDAASDLFAAHGASVHGVPVDGAGLVVRALPATARLVYVTPSHQFPTGVAMSLQRRTELLDWAVRHDALIVEDDYDSEYRFADRPLEPLQSLDREGRVAYVGTFSKSLLPALRIGYVVAPASLQPALRAAKRLTVWSGDGMTQAALADFIAGGHYAAHVRRTSRVYRDRHETLLAAMEPVAEGLEIVRSFAGLHVCTYLRDGTADDRAIAARAALDGVLVEPLSVRYRDHAPRPGLVFGIGAITASQIPSAVATVAAALPAR